MLYEEDRKLIWKFDKETLIIEPWCKNALRVRVTHEAVMPDELRALLPPEPSDCHIEINGDVGNIKNGKIQCSVEKNGKLRFCNSYGKLLLEEMYRDMNQKDFSSHMRISARELRGIPGGLFKVIQRFESDPYEKLYGMGSYQHGIFNLKGARLELMQRNSQTSVPFVLSNLGYGMLWNNPAIGEVMFAINETRWLAESTHMIDYWIVAGDTPDEIVENYVCATGRPPMMPESAMGFWQCKLRYRTQQELLNVAREYKRRGLPISVIVVDFYHWTKHGEWKFDPKDWPDPNAMTNELKQMGVDTAVSVWPTVQLDSENFGEMLEKGYLIDTDNGVRLSMRSSDWTVFFDATNPDARKFVWEKCKKSYFDTGVKYFWLDVAEPQYTCALNNGAEAYRYSTGPHMVEGNTYPVLYTQAFYDGLKENGIENPLCLVRSAWAGSQRYGALVWSGDIHSSFKSMRWQLAAGLNAGIAGLSWWTTDTGGFDWGNINDEGFRELMVRWFQWSTFCPVMRMHGDRQPHTQMSESGLSDYSGADNEIWSFGEKAYTILAKYLKLRYALLPYVRNLMREAHLYGRPVMRPLFYHYPQDIVAWNVSDSYLFGRDILVAPVLEAGANEREVYLPKGEEWQEIATGKIYAGGQCVVTKAPIEIIPLFVRGGVHIDGLN